MASNSPTYTFQNTNINIQSHPQLFYMTILVSKYHSNHPLLPRPFLAPTAPPAMLAPRTSPEPPPLDLLLQPVWSMHYCVCLKQSLKVYYIPGWWPRLKGLPYTSGPNTPNWVNRKQESSEWHSCQRLSL